MLMMDNLKKLKLHIDLIKEYMTLKGAFQYKVMHFINKEDAVLTIEEITSNGEKLPLYKLIVNINNDIYTVKSEDGIDCINAIKEHNNLTKEDIDNFNKRCSEIIKEYN